MTSPDDRAALTDAAAFDMLSHLARQSAFSLHTFGPGMRTKGVVDHIRKELREIEDDPSDLSEWIDVVILALDGAWRAGGTPESIIRALVAKQTKNEGRAWPDWRTADPDKAIEHDRTADAASQPHPVNRADDKAGSVMHSAYNLCPDHIKGQPARMRWIANYFLTHYEMPVNRADGDAAPWPGCSQQVCRENGACWDAGKCLKPVNCRADGDAVPLTIKQVSAYLSADSFTRPIAEDRCRNPVWFDAVMIGVRIAEKHAALPASTDAVPVAIDLEAFANHVRDGIADYIADNMLDRKHSLAEIDAYVRAIEINANRLAAPIASALPAQNTYVDKHNPDGMHASRLTAAQPGEPK